MDRPTGNYDHERLIALEDSHKAMIDWIDRELGWLKHIRPQVSFPKTIGLGFDQANASGLTLIKQAYEIRKEAGIE